MAVPSSESPLLNGGIDDAFPTMGDILDVNDHPDVNLPPPGHSPSPQHSTKMAGDVLPFPTPMSESDTNRMISRTAPNKSKVDRDWRGNPKPVKILRGPGSND